MKKIPSNVPVFIQDFKSQENGRYSTAKLKVFYQGETGDHRLFTRKFSDTVLTTLPSTPVVAFYSEEDEDFRGHNEIQYVYGHVPETATIEYVEEDDKMFAVTDVILYTERNDNIGEIAKKIIGKQHSLELDPRTLKYRVNYDTNNNFLNIEFLDGQFIGLSVLGDDESPAFAGSGFFTTEQSFQEFTEQCHLKLDRFFSFLNNNGGGIQVFNKTEFFSKTNEFFVRTMQEFQEDIYAALEAMGIYGIIQENTEKYVVVYQYNMDTDRCEFIKYSIEEQDGQLSLVNPVSVRARYLTDDELNSSPTFAAEEEEKEPVKDVDDKEEEEPEFVEQEEEKKDEEEEEEKPEEPEFAEVPVEDKKDKDEDKPENCETGTEDDKEKPDVTDKQPEEKEEEEEQMGDATTIPSASSLVDSERIELDNYRRAAKIAIIDSYADDLDSETIATYRANVDNYSAEALEAALAIDYRKFVKTNPEVQGYSTPVVTSFSVITPATSYNECSSADAIRKYK